MAAVDIFNVSVLDNPSPFESPISFEITYEVREPLKEDIEWKVIYVGSAEDESYDQELESVLLPAETPGRFGFILQVDAPDPQRLPVEDILGVTIILLSCSYKDKEFIRVGYYVNNEYTDPELIENPPATPIIQKITRNIGADQPRVTKFPHLFDYQITDVRNNAEGAMNVGNEEVDVDMEEVYWMQEQQRHQQQQIKKLQSSGVALSREQLLAARI
mmetsp:Transcript_4947/g.9068  ORF Transcript_4947/g.9068 Transcript_4947/m.9068 type:complete len:217 (-) Transcript_4947:40-690(-)|eukprot:CAMPEP_0184708536 /NCGR_PEP_ID=MMETSP0313-20130426/37829_1 /TAXON_ID=2792 /ORGANISM="Porphyridium aerugineum, Strain SAG 1380-2" /LENGTH=216 /DNA_ID=CAMNT_0027170131 /DNA_START=392 /DNA_END=1042 /DNA_ORIENTATION=-